MTIDRTTRLGALALCLAASLAGAAAADELPSRKAGLWEATTSASDGTTSARQCIDADTDRKAQEAGEKRGQCSKNTVTRAGDGYDTATTCSLGQIVVEGRGRVTGDFETYVRTETETTLTGVPGVDQPTPKKTVIEAKRLGDCEAGQRPGDVILPDGKVFHMDQ